MSQRTFTLTPPHQCTHCCAPSYSLTLVFAYFSPWEPPHRSATLPTNLGTNNPTSAHVRTLYYGGSEAFLLYKRIVAPMLSGRLYGGIWEKSIEFLQKVYRVFSESL